ncbi:transforming growth factor beta-1 proprotein-like [Ochotona princeps]|uniref:transforming growth factor beta-1 proprotein-like n=1 Tax=Ochotona princeps TaxID=9978 RepID=UPI002714B9E3|nr:transforming growth factor beta-1 proprotein-like [Ochotona princeps]
MLPSGLQMLLLWLLLCMAKLGLSSPQSQGDIMTGPVPEDMPTLYHGARDGVGKEPIRAWPEGMCEESVEEEMEREPEYYPTNVSHVKMVDSSSGIYKKFENRQDSVYMVFNKAKFREAVPDPSSLVRADLKLHLLRQSAGQMVNLYERYGKNSWRLIKNWLLILSESPEWLSLDVTGVVCQWLRSRGEFEVFRLTAEKSCYTDNVLHVEISGINPMGYVDLLDNDGISVNQPRLRLVSYPPDQHKLVDSSQYP